MALPPKLTNNSSSHKDTGGYVEHTQLSAVPFIIGSINSTHWSVVKAARTPSACAVYWPAYLGNDGDLVHEKEFEFM